MYSQRYILYSARGDIAQIFIQEVNEYGNATTGEPVSLITATLDWEMDNNEAPTLVKHNGKYLLFYSACPVDERYTTGFAVSNHLKGPYVKADAPLMSTDSFNGTVVGPGGEDVITGNDGTDYIVYHGYDSDMRKRMLYVNHLQWTEDGEPVISDDL
jgi:GH43 family beta-xylosidase